jgi:hypothetical protein
MIGCGLEVNDSNSLVISFTFGFDLETHIDTVSLGTFREKILIDYKGKVHARDSIIILHEDCDLGRIIYKHIF